MHIKSSFPLLPCFEVGSIFFSTLNIPLFQQLEAKGGSRMWLKVKMTLGGQKLCTGTWLLQVSFQEDCMYGTGKQQVIRWVDFGQSKILVKPFLLREG